MKTVEVSMFESGLFCSWLCFWSARGKAKIKGGQYGYSYFDRFDAVYDRERGWRVGVLPDSSNLCLKIPELSFIARGVASISQVRHTVLDQDYE